MSEPPTPATPVTLITGGAGEIGVALLRRRAEFPVADPVVTVDLRDLPPSLVSAGSGTAPVEHFRGDILDESLWREFDRRYRPRRVFHLAAVLSTRAERVPALAHRVNADGAARMLARSLEWAGKDGPVRFLFPSSVAVYGMASRSEKEAASPVAEDERLDPRTLYGAQKLYVERLGAVMERETPDRLDFRAMRFPGLISADTLPQGGTSDWAPELIHAAARGEPYSCFVRADARLPFCAMPDAVGAFLALAFAEKGNLSRLAYNLGGASLSAAEIVARVRRDFPALVVRYRLDRRRDRIVAGWPAAVDDSAARRDFGFVPSHDRETLFSRYLIPGIHRRYAERPSSSVPGPDSARPAAAAAAVSSGTSGA